MHRPARVLLLMVTTAGAAACALACQAGTGFLDNSLDRSCVPDFPGETFEFDASEPTDPDLDCRPEVDPEPAPEDDERVAAECFTKTEAAEPCPAADDALVLDALEASLIYDCGDCVLDTYRIACEVDAGRDSDLCCYRYFVVEATCATSE